MSARGVNDALILFAPVLAPTKRQKQYWGYTEERSAAKEALFIGPDEIIIIKGD